MKSYLEEFTLMQKITILFVVIFVIADILLISSKISFFLVPLIVFVIINLKSNNTSRISIKLSALFLITAVVIFLLDITGSLSLIYQKISDWAYLFLLIGIIQLVLENKYK